MSRTPLTEEQVARLVGQTERFTDERHQHDLNIRRLERLRKRAMSGTDETLRLAFVHITGPDAPSATGADLAQNIAMQIARERQGIAALDAAIAVNTEELAQGRKDA